MKKPFSKRNLCIMPLLLFMIVIVAAFQQSLTLRTYKITTDKITESVRIAVITDLHSTIYGSNQTHLLEELASTNPDLILLVGDIADDQVSHDGTEQLLSIIGSEYPCYYVSGNHEVWSGEIDTIKEMIRSYGVTVLEGTSELISIRDQSLLLCGVDDPELFFGYADTLQTSADSWQTQLQNFASTVESSVYSILLSHRPELVDSYTDSAFDLVVSGHAHGGQVRIPFLLNGLYAPNQGLFPKYAGGEYKLGSTTMIVSRGLCKNNLPRVFNPPELVVVDLLPEL